MYQPIGAIGVENVLYPYNFASLTVYSLPAPVYNNGDFCEIVGNLWFRVSILALELGLVRVRVIVAINLSG